MVWWRWRQLLTLLMLRPMLPQQLLLGSKQHCTQQHISARKSRSGCNSYFNSRYAYLVGFLST